MHWTLQVCVALLNIVWVAFFLTPEPFSGFVRRRRTNEEPVFREFCLQPPAVKIPSNKTNNTETTFQGNSSLAPENETTVRDELGLTSTGSPPQQGLTAPASPPELEWMSPVSCCFEFSTGALPLQMIKGYVKLSSMCPVVAIIIVTTEDHSICVDPEAAWVKTLLRSLDEIRTWDDVGLLTPSDSPELGLSTPGSPPELGLSTPGGPPELGLSTPGGPPELGLSTPGSPPERKPMSPGALGPDDCCFKLWTRRVNKNLIRSYYMTDSRCLKTAAILVTKKSSRICVDPNLSWVKGIMKFVDNSTF